MVGNIATNAAARATWVRPVRYWILGGDGNLPERRAETAAAANLLGKSKLELSVPRSHLIDKGLLYAPKRGVLGFAVPRMAEYIVRQTD